MADANPVVRFTGAADATGGYAVTIKNSNGIACSNNSVSAGAGQIDATFGSCFLTNSETYDAVVRSIDGAGNYTDAVFSFHVDYVAAKIVNVGTANGTINGGYAQ